MSLPCIGAAMELLHAAVTHRPAARNHMSPTSSSSSSSLQLPSDKAAHSFLFHHFLSSRFCFCPLFLLPFFLYFHFTFTPFLFFLPLASFVPTFLISYSSFSFPFLLFPSHSSFSIIPPKSSPFLLPLPLPPLLRPALLPA